MMINRQGRYRREGAFPCASESAGAPTMNASSVSALKKRLQKVDFALSDTILYLDAYPESKAAMAHYQKLLEEHDSIIAKLNAAGVPMTPLGNYSDEWKWTYSPWPWEYEANV